MSGDPKVQPAGLSPITAAANLRRSVIVAVAIAVVAIAVSSVVGHPLFGVFGALGLALGAGNNWLLQREVVRYGTSLQMSRKRFSGGVFRRLLGLTILAAALALLVKPDGLGTFAGLAVFQILMLIGAAVPILRSLRPTS
jgi:hypothetical protein